MIVRKIKPEEFKRTEEMFSIAFTFPYDCEKEPMELYKEKMENPEAREDVKPLDKYAAFEDDDKTMMSCFSATHFPMNFNGQKVTMIGIGGVSTSPCYRRKGGIRGCFTKMLPDVYEAGAIFSYLYPFSTCFYNKFGYGMGIRGKVYELDLSRIPKFDIGGSFVLAEPSNSKELLSEFKEVYEVWQQKYNGMIINSSMEYRFVTEANPCKEQEFLYLYQGADKTPKAYLSLHKESDNGESILVCKKFIFKDAEGLKGLLQLAAGYAADYRSIRFSVPEDIQVEAVMKEFSFGACRLHTSYMGMVRVDNVAKALKLSSYQGSGEISIHVTDPYIEENNGTFHVIYEDGKAVSVERQNEIADGEAEPDEKNAVSGADADAVAQVSGVICMHIDRFSEFIFQNRPAENFLYYEEGSLREEDVCKLEQTFARKTSFLMEYF